jgi:hypothetical protein
MVGELKPAPALKSVNISAALSACGDDGGNGSQKRSNEATGEKRRNSRFSSLKKEVFFVSSVGSVAPFLRSGASVISPPLRVPQPEPERPYRI